MRKKEVEAKYRLTMDPAAFKRMLKRNGFRLYSDNREIDTYYSRPDLDFMKTVECLRIRRRKGFCEMTYKPPTIQRPAKGFVAKKETNVLLYDESEWDTAKELMKNLGMIELVVVDKHRSTYKNPAKEEISIVIDDLKGAGTFIEIEAISSDIESARAELSKLAELMKLSENDLIKLPYRDIVMEAMQRGD